MNALSNGKRPFVGLGLLAGLLYLAPLGAFLYSGRSLFLTFWEFACYRYYGALSMLHGDFASIWVVQGFPMAIIQTGFAKYFLHHSPDDLGSVAQIDHFATATIVCAYGLGSLAMIGLWVAPCITFGQKIILTAGTLLMWPLTRYYSYLYAPDYWIFEVPLYFFSVAWFMTVIESDANLEPSRKIGWRFTLLAGFWMALCFLQKPSCLAIAALPFLGAVSRARISVVHGLIKAVALLLFTAGFHWLLFLSYYLFSRPAAWSAYKHYWDWLIFHPETGTSLATSFGELLRAGNYLFVPIVIGLLFLVWFGITSFTSRIANRWNRPIAVYLVLAALGHGAVIVKRASGTSVIDAMLFCTFLVPVIFSISAVASQRKIGLAYAGLAVVGLLFWNPRLFMIWPKRNEGEVIARIEQIRAEVKGSGRPVVLLLPDNRIYPHTAEAFGLYTGHLNTAVNDYGPDLLPRPFPPTALRQQLFPNTFLYNRGDDENLRVAFDAGYLVIWGEANHAPRIQEVFPGVDHIIARTDVVHKIYDILPNESVRTHVAYRIAARPPAR